MDIQPRIGVSIVILHHARAVIVRRGKEPFLGYWSLPGGAVELGESLAEAARREALEETGLDVEIGNFLKAFDLIRRDAQGRVESHFVLAAFQARCIGGALAAGDDADDAIWAAIDDLGQIKLTPGLEEFLIPLLTEITGL